MAYPEFNPAQPPSIRQLNRKYASIEAKNTQKRARRKKSLNKLKESTVELLEGFGEKTTIHGLNRLLERNSNKYERCFWLLTLGTALCGTIYVCILLSGRFQAGTLQSIVDDTALGVYRIPFPAITICNVNGLNKERLQAAKELFLPNETNEETLQMFETVIQLYDKIKFGAFNIFKRLEGLPVHLVEHVNFTLVYEFMTWRCDELLEDCEWRHQQFNCCDIFLKRHSNEGTCYTFNSLENDEGRERHLKDPKYPWHNGNAGPKSALRLKAMTNPEKQFTAKGERGITLMVAEPGVWHLDPYFIPENTDTSVDIEATIYLYDNDTKSLSPAQRKCYFSDERNSKDRKTLQGFVYMIENCLSECHQEYLVRFCNCTMDLFFPVGPYTSCRVSDLICLARYNDYFRHTHQPGEEKYVNRRSNHGMICHCFHNCYSLQYMTYVRPAFLTPEVRGNKSYVDLDIHFRSETLMVYSTNLVFSWIDLMVAFGGIAGLFLGCSLLSAVEVFHFLFIELPIFIYTEVKYQKELKVLSNHITKLQSIQGKEQQQQQNQQQLEHQHQQQQLEQQPPPKYNWFIRNRISVTDLPKMAIKSNENINYISPKYSYY